MGLECYNSGLVDEEFYLGTELPWNFVAKAAGARELGTVKVHKKFGVLSFLFNNDCKNPS